MVHIGPNLAGRYTHAVTSWTPLASYLLHSYQIQVGLQAYASLFIMARHRDLQLHTCAVQVARSYRPKTT